MEQGEFGEDEEALIIRLHALLGNRWSLIAGRLPGRKAEEVKNHWESHIKTKLINAGIDPANHLPDPKITCVYSCNKHQPQPSSRTTTKSLSSSSSSALRNDPPRKLSRSEQDDGEIDLTLKIGLPNSASFHDHHLISTVVEVEKKKKEEVVVVSDPETEAQNYHDAGNPALPLFK